MEIEVTQEQQLIAAELIGQWHGGLARATLDQNHSAATACRDRLLGADMILTALGLKKLAGLAVAAQSYGQDAARETM